MASLHAPSLGPTPEHPFLDGARRASLVVLGIWATARLTETGFALWVRYAASSPPPE